MTENNHIQEQTHQQQEKLANTISKKNESWISVGVRELMHAIGAGSKKPEKRHHNPYQISEGLEQFDKNLNKKRPPIVIN